MVDPERLHRVLRRVSGDLRTLRGYADGRPGEVLADPARLGHVKYVFITAIEGCIDAAQHVCASEGLGAPDTNGDAMRLLGEHGLVPRDLAQRLAAAVGFRNVLVHGYASVDDARVVAMLTQLGDLRALVQHLTTLIAAADDGA